MPDTANLTDLFSGRGLPKVDPSRSVFINCPYDSEYEPLRDALVFAAVCCGFIPRSADESGKGSASRIERIFHAVYTSNYSIHDLSRCRGEGEDLLARFNMPLELGIAMSRRYSGAKEEDRHDWLILIPDNAPYFRFVSDLAGYDLTFYAGDVESIVQRVTAWFVSQDAALGRLKLSPKPVLENLEKFRQRKTALKTEWNQIPWKILVDAAIENAPKF